MAHRVQFIVAELGPDADPFISSLARFRGVDRQGGTREGREKL
jgi:hypothetical protein